MKNLIFIIALVFATVFQSQGQIVLQLQNFPTAGDTIAYDYFIADSSFNEGNDGANVTWDFSNINLPPVNGPIPFLQYSSTTPICLAENTAGTYVDTFALVSGYFNYYTSNLNYDLQSSGWWSWGPHYSECYSTPWKKMKFPFTYHDSLISNFNYSWSGWGYGVNGLRSGVDTTICDGYGTVIGLSGGSFNALRTKSIIYQSDSITNKIVSYSIIYNWYSSTHKGPFATLKYIHYQMDTLTNQWILSSKLFEIQNSNSTTVGISNIESKIDHITLVNSIATDKIKIDFNDSEFGNYNLSIYSLNGELIYNDLVFIGSNNQSIEIPVSSYTNGLYIVRFEFEKQYIGSYKFVKN